MSEAVEIFGLELLINQTSKSFTSSLDALVASIHWFIIKEGAKCIHADGKKRETLPENWNGNQNEYLIEYSKEEKRYFLKVIRMDNVALCHLMEENSDKVACMTLTIDDIITSDFQNFDNMYRDLRAFYNQFNAELAALLSPKSEQKTQTEERPREQTSREDPLRVVHPRPARPHRPDAPYFDPSGIGVGDLDPLRAGQGGMIFDPFQHGGHRIPRPGVGIPGGIPPGSVPPGARFDPFGPDIENNGRGPFRRGPDPDHMQPPPWYM